MQWKTSQILQQDLKQFGEKLHKLGNIIRLFYKFNNIFYVENSKFVDFQQIFVDFS